MLARARRAFPGMVVSMLLAGPAMAASAGTHATAEHPAPRIAHPLSDHRKIAQRNPRAAKTTRIARNRARPAEIVPATFFTGPYPVQSGAPRYAAPDGS